MSGKRRSPAQITRDRRQISDLYLQGTLQSEIAVQLNLSQPTVSRDIKALQKQWLADASANFDAAKARELAKIDALERTYHTAWVRSCEDAETTTQKQKGKAAKRIGEDGKFVVEQPAELSKTRKEQQGNPRFLDGVQWCIEKRSKVWGFDKPIKVAPTDPTGEHAYQPITDTERLAALAAFYEQFSTEAAGRTDSGEH